LYVSIPSAQARPSSGFSSFGRSFSLQNSRCIGSCQLCWWTFVVKRHMHRLQSFIISLWPLGVQLFNFSESIDELFKLGLFMFYGQRSPRKKSVSSSFRVYGRIFLGQHLGDCQVRCVYFCSSAGFSLSLQSGFSPSLQSFVSLDFVHEGAYWDFGFSCSGFSKKKTICVLM
jgi:hypothetical protein